ncbi:MAG: nickel/cobalt transporter [Phycisphaerae bacterium]
MRTTSSRFLEWWFAAATWLMCVASALAHPLGNDNVEHVNVLWIFPDRVEVDCLLFVAENPSSRIEQAEMDTDKDESVSTDEQQAWLELEAGRQKDKLRVTLDGRPLPLRTVEAAGDPKTGKRSFSNRLIIELPGLGGMPTYRLLIRYYARFDRPLTDGVHTLTFEDLSYLGNPGLKRVLLERLPDIEVLSPHPEFWTTDPFLFEQYDPANLPQERSAIIRFRLAAPASTPVPGSTQEETVSSRPDTGGRPEVPDRYERGLTAPVAGVPTTYQAQANRLLELLQGRWGLMVFLMITGLAFTWGAAHALMPGHAKTVVAAYLISQSGTYWHAVLLAIVVTITHTALVVVLGAVWAFYQATNPALGPKLQLWLGLISGLLVAGMGLTLIWRACRGSLAQHHHDPGHPEPQSWFRRLFGHSHVHPSTRAHDHPHDHATAHHHHHHHHHDAHTHDHGHPAVSPLPHATPPSLTVSDRVSSRVILMLGITGGIVPCPTATIIMLLGIGANVVVGALYAVAVFSLGLALTLMLIGFLALSSRRFATRLMSGDDKAEHLSGGGRLILLRVVPAVSGLAVVLLGLAISANYIHYMYTSTALFLWMG